MKTTLTTMITERTSLAYDNSHKNYYNKEKKKKERRKGHVDVSLSALRLLSRVLDHCSSCHPEDWLRVETS